MSPQEQLEELTRTLETQRLLLEQVTLAISDAQEIIYTTLTQLAQQPPKEQP